MKNIIAFVLGIAIFAAPAAALARTVNVAGGSLDCDTNIVTDSGGATTTASQAQQINCQAQNGNPFNIMEVWGLTAGDSMQQLWVPAGTVVSDERGIKSGCPLFYKEMYNIGCFDISRTAYYRHLMGYDR